MFCCLCISIPVLKSSLYDKQMNKERSTVSSIFNTYRATQDWVYIQKWQVGGEFTLYLLFILCEGPDDGLINLKH